MVPVDRERPRLYRSVPWTAPIDRKASLIRWRASERCLISCESDSSRSPARSAPLSLGNNEVIVSRATRLALINASVVLTLFTLPRPCFHRLLSLPLLGEKEGEDRDRKMANETERMKGKGNRLETYRMRDLPKNSVVLVSTSGASEFEPNSSVASHLRQNL